MLFLGNVYLFLGLGVVSEFGELEYLFNIKKWSTKRHRNPENYSGFQVKVLIL